MGSKGTFTCRAILVLPNARFGSFVPSLGNQKKLPSWRGLSMTWRNTAKLTGRFVSAGKRLTARQMLSENLTCELLHGINKGQYIKCRVERFGEAFVCLTVPVRD